MANETSTRAPLTATVGERLDEKAHEGATPGVERAAAAVEDLRGAGYEGEGREPAGRRPEGRKPEERKAERRREGPGQPQASRRERHAAGPQRTRSRPRGSRIGWAVVAGLGTWMVVGMVGRAFRR